MLKYFLPSWLNEKSVVISGGGYLGEWDLYVSSTYKCRVFVFEPARSNFKELLPKFKGHRNIRLVLAALWDSDGRAMMYFVSKSNGHSLYNRSKYQQITGAEYVKCTRLKTYMDIESIATIDLLKLNVEGAEVQILNDIDADLAKRIKTICFSDHVGKITTKEKHQATITHLESIGYRVTPWTGGTWKFTNRWRCEYENPDLSENADAKIQGITAHT